MRVFVSESGHVASETYSLVHLSVRGRPTTSSFFVGNSAMCHSRNVRCVTQQTCLMWHTADVSAVSHSRHVCWVIQQTFPLCHNADMSAASHSRHVCCVAHGISAVSRSRHVCCVKQQSCLLWGAADMSAVSYSRHVCCATQQTSAARNIRHVYCVTQQTRLRGDAADPFASDLTQNVLLRRRREGGKHPHLRHKTLAKHMQDLHYASLWSYVAGGVGHDPPHSCDTRP